MTEPTSNISILPEQPNHVTPVSQSAAVPFWRSLVVARWLQQKLSQILSQFHLLAITRGRSLRWQRLCRQIIQAGSVLLVVMAVMPPPVITSAISPLTQTGMQPDGANPFAGVDVGDYSKPGFADINADGDQDAFIGEFNGTIVYYQNTGSAISPSFSQLTGTLNPFNEVAVGQMSAPSFADLDADGDLDAIIGEYDQTINYFENTGTATSPAFVQRAGTLNPFNDLIVGYHSTPSLADLDADGDLDLVVGADDGTIQYFENTGSPTNPAFIQRTGSLNPFNGVDVGDDSTPSFADWDADGDLDAIIGEYDGNLNYFQNIGNATNLTFIQRSGSLNPFNGLDVGRNSAPSFANLGADGDLDCFIGAENGNIAYFENTRNPNLPHFTERTGSNNPLVGVNIGGYCRPSFADLEADGDQDAFIGEGSGNINYFKNTGSATSPLFSELTGSLNPFNGVVVSTFSSPSFADLDADGDLDAVIGRWDGYLSYFKNTGTATSPLFTLITGSLNPFNLVDVYLNGGPTFADLDADGDLDLFVGDYYGTIEYYQNTGSATSPAFKLRTGNLNPFYGVIVDFYSTPSFADMDGDGDLDLFIGEWKGTIHYIQNTGSATNPTFTQRSGSNNPLNGVHLYDTAPSFADLDGDGDLDAFIGETYGTVHYYENFSVVSFNYRLNLPMVAK